MKRKKLLAFVLASAMTLSMAACGNSGDPAENSSSTSQESSGSSTTPDSSSDQGSSQASGDASTPNGGGHL